MIYFVDSQSEAVQLSGTGSELAEVTVAGGSDTTAVATTAEDDEEEAVDLEGRICTLNLPSQTAQSQGLPDFYEKYI